jgi:hypothetical protein
MGGMMEEDVWVVFVPQDQRKLHAAAPVVGHVVRFETVFEIDRALVEDVIPEREEQNPPA